MSSIILIKNQTRLQKALNYINTQPSPRLEASAKTKINRIVEFLGEEVIDLLDDLNYSIMLLSRIYENPEEVKRIFRATKERARNKSHYFVKCLKRQNWLKNLGKVVKETAKKSIEVMQKGMKKLGDIKTIEEEKKQEKKDENQRRQEYYEELLKMGVPEYEARNYAKIAKNI